MIDTTRAIRNIDDVIRILPGAFLLYGTALGALREGRILPWDPDTDLGIMPEDFVLDQAQADLIAAGFHIERLYACPGAGLQLVMRRIGIKTDLWVFSRTDTGFANALHAFEGPIVHNYPADVLEIGTSSLYGRIYPCPSHRYVEHVYGPEWRTPIKKFDWRKDHACTPKTG